MPSPLNHWSFVTEAKRKISHSFHWTQPINWPLFTPKITVCYTQPLLVAWSDGSIEIENELDKHTKALIFRLRHSHWDVKVWVVRTCQLRANWIEWKNASYFVPRTITANAMMTITIIILVVVAIVLCVFFGTGWVDQCLRFHFSVSLFVSVSPELRPIHSTT